MNGIYESNTVFQIEGLSMPKPISLLEACRMTAHAAGVPWSHGLRVYRGMQDAELIPKSSGRQVHKAYPGGVALFLLGLASSPDPDLAGSAVGTLMECAAPTGVTMSAPLVDALAWMLSTPSAAAAVSEIEIRRDTVTAIVRWKTRRRLREGLPARAEHTFTAKPELTQLNSAPFIRFRGVIDGRVVEQIAREIPGWWHGHHEGLVTFDAGVEESA